METVITAIIVIGLMILSILGLSERAMSGQAALAEANRVMQERMADRAHTGLTALDASTTIFGDYVQVTLKNTGNTKLADFDQWDVIVQYTDDASGEHAAWYGYPAQWSRQIYQTASPPTPEVIDPGILNPGEELVLQVNLTPAVGAGTTNLAAVSAPNGVTASIVFTR